MSTTEAALGKLRHWNRIVIGVVAIYGLTVFSFTAVKDIQTSTGVRSLLHTYHNATAKKLDLQTAEISEQSKELDQRDATIAALSANDASMAEALRNFHVPAPVLKPVPSPGERASIFPPIVQEPPPPGPTPSTNPPASPQPPPTITCIPVPKMPNLPCVPIKANA